ncbi:hypothetical protein NBRC10512v2_000903 [Rhodotorula toruloides]
MADYLVKLATPTQCATQTISWSGGAGAKALSIFVQGQGWFAEQLSNNLTDTLGSINWTCDIPAGAFIAFELYSMPDAKNHFTTGFFQVQQGTTGDCIGKNGGQLAADKMSTIYNSLTSANPQLFTYPATSSSATPTSSSSSPTTAAPSSSSSAAPSATAASGKSTSTGALVGGIVGGVAGLCALFALLLFFFLRRRRGSSYDGQSTVPPSEKTSPAPVGGAGGVATWRNRVQDGRPPSAWTRRSRLFSIGTTQNGGPLSEYAPTVPAAFPSTASPPHQVPTPSQGPREGVPEVGESSDYSSSRRAPPAIFSAVPAQRGGLASHPLSQEEEALLHSAPRVTPYQQQETPKSPPGRLPTPGAATAFGGDGTASEGGERWSTIPYTSYGRTGTPGTKTLTRLTPSETNARLKENEASFAVQRRNNPVIRYDTNNLASNSPIEDDSCCVILERDHSSKVQGDLIFFGVFDGHGGWQTSRLLSSSLVSYVAKELDLVFRGSDTYLSLLDPKPTPSGSSLWSLFGGKSNDAPKPQLDVHDPIMQQAIKNAFGKMDQEIVSAPIRLLEKLQKEGKLPDMKQGGIGIEQSEALNTLLPALSGSCALLAFLDAGRNKLHVACTGDSRAVMGVWVPDGQGGGQWRVEPLSEDQTGRNPSEVARVQSEHPANEVDTVISRGRVLGGLEPTRAFGDARYKWPPGTQQKLANAFHPGSVRGPPRNYHTPPYVTATPEVVTVDLSAERPKRARKSIGSFLPVSSPEEPPATRFIVLATDGLYDRLDNQEIVSLVGAHLCGLRGDQTRQAVLSNSVDPTAVSGPHNSHAPRQQPTRGEGEVFTFEDGNLATHLIRNSLGGAKREQVSVLLSVPAPLSRRYRDDITCTVILLGDASKDGEGGSGGVYRREEGFETPLKAKL